MNRSHAHRPNASWTPRCSPHPGEGIRREVLGAFLNLGLTSLRGPIAHLGHFRDEPVTRRGWLSDRAYADHVALCQVLQGPAPSHVGFALGLTRTGWRGALAAFALAPVCFVLLMVWKEPPWAVVIVAALGGSGLTLLA